MSATSGLTSRQPLAFYDPDSLCWRTSQATFLSDSTPSPLTLPAWGTWDGGALYALPTSAPATSAHGSSSWLPTPAAGNFNDTESIESWEARRQQQKARGLNGNGFGTPLAMAVQMLPTPDAAMGMGGHEARGGKRSDELLLPGLVKTFLPTPAAWDGDRGPDYAKANREGSGGDDLTTTMARLLPTPTTSDAKGPSPNHGGTSSEAIRDLLPTPNASDFRGSTSPESAKDWEQRGVNLPERIQRLRGAATSQQSGATSSPSVDPHPDLWTTLDD